MSKEQISTMINKQITKEFFSAYLYLAISNYFAQQNLDGFTNWYEVQAKEELDHAMLFRKYLLNEGHAVQFEQIGAPDVSYKTLGEALATTVTHEQMITASITEIYTAALDCKDYKTTQLLDWFVKEQGEEEKSATDLCNKFQLFGNDTMSLYLLNAELMTRAYAPPSLVL